VRGRCYVKCAIFFAAVGSLISAEAGIAQQQQQFSTEVNRVEITFTVTDRRGHSATLGRSDIEVFDDQRPQRIIDFSPESELPLRLALLIDTSNSVRDRFRFLQEAAIEFLNRSLRTGIDEAMVVSFDSSPDMALDFSFEERRLDEKIRDLRPGGATALYDAIDLAARRLAEAARVGPRHRAAIVIFSDGEDNESRLTRGQALQAAQRANAVLFAVSTREQGPEVEGDKVLQFVTSETGGIALFPFRMEDLGHSFDNVANLLRHQYNILYRPEPFVADGKFHPVEIRLKQQKGLVVRARKGYYAPAAPAPAK